MKRLSSLLLLVSLVLLVSACSSAVAAPPPAAPTPTTEHDMSEMEMGETMPGGHGEAVSAEGVPLATEALGGQPLAYTQAGEVKVFELVAQTVHWPILENVYVTAWTYNGAVN